jgi:hypothetical protein
VARLDCGYGLRCALLPSCRPHHRYCPRRPHRLADRGPPPW